VAQTPLGRIETNLAAIAFVLGAAYLLAKILTGDVLREPLGPTAGNLAETKA
jgi:hypothetical protein